MLSNIVCWFIGRNSHSLTSWAVWYLPVSIHFDLFLRSHSHYSHSLEVTFSLFSLAWGHILTILTRFFAIPSTIASLYRTVALTFVNSIRCQQLQQRLTKWPLDHRAMFKIPRHTLHLRSWSSSWLRATHRSGVGFVPLTDPKLATCYFRSNSAGSAPLRWPRTASYRALVGIKTSLSYLFVSVCFISISLSLSHF